MSDYNVRYGAELRKRAAKVDRDRRARYVCPKCGKKSIKRAGTNSVWVCKSCGAKIAGGTYQLSTPTGELNRRLILERQA